eukprot:Hpha_TRINITY_DN31805_c0_g1::TRINITY_DN31805_c0_g1_i1::g.30101::m.30101
MLTPSNLSSTKAVYSPYASYGNFNCGNLTIAEMPSVYHMRIFTVRPEANEDGSASRRAALDRSAKYSLHSASPSPPKGIAPVGNGRQGEGAPGGRRVGGSCGAATMSTWVLGKGLLREGGILLTDRRAGNRCGLGPPTTKALSSPTTTTTN